MSKKQPEEPYLSVLDEPMDYVPPDARTWFHRLAGRRGPQRTYFLSRRLFCSMLGAIYAVAFASLWVQIHGLVGSKGILPAAPFLESVAEQYGPERYRLLPTLGWFDASDTALSLYCGIGFLCGLLVMSGVLVRVTLALCWILYLSLFHLGRDFMSFQWDILLLETSFLAIFLAPIRPFPNLSDEGRVPMAPLWLLRWLLFRLMFSSGIVKLGDEAWMQLTALHVHYETQPLPTTLGWYVHQLPGWFQSTSVAVMFVVEIIVPFLIFLPRPFRTTACVTTIAFQLVIILTGNYCFFNLLAIALCMLLLDDDHWRWLLPQRLMTRVRFPEGLRPAGPVRLTLAIALGVPMVVLSFAPLSRILAPSAPVLDAIRQAHEFTQPFHIVSGYGLFARMTVERPEIVIEGSNDQVEWRAYDFKWKPGALDERPRLVAPHQPRLDWQMWFAALSPTMQPSWFGRLLERLLEGEPSVLALLNENPFPEAPPRYVRAVYYRYEFTDMDERRETGNWWKRERLGLYRTPAALGP